MSTRNSSRFDATRDPLHVLNAAHTPGFDDPVRPDRDFAAALRDRLERGANLPEGVVMATATQLDASETAPSAAPSRGEPVVERPGALPYLVVAEPQAAIDWYVDAFGARLRGEPIVMADGVIGHAELELGGGAVYLAAEFPDLGLRAPAPGQVSVSLMVAVDDTDDAVSSAARAGAAVTREPYEDHGTRTAVVVDPFGHRWMLSGPSKTTTPAVIRQGDVGFMSLNTPDAARARRFYGDVLGWEFDSQGRRVINVGHRLGIFETPGAPTMFCAYAVDDLQAAHERIVAAGGQGTFGSSPDGHRVVDAVDDQGVRFAVFASDPEDTRPEAHPRAPGAMTYLTVLTPDSGRFREFYGSVLGWTFHGGRVDDGWEVDDSRPQIGLAGGADRPVAVPMWTTDDVVAAVERVRAAGGTVLEEPSTAPYGVSARCADDQGGQFYLGQLF
ncbi:glyoxalase/ bleomycin resistance protein/ dioxygenase [Gordonia terrae C-6]|uniref:Glyoxalase/ bleomycin resistance protein/ dioxygenase n=1 Tax=Gordonia terrae C-6 TaxID=1316928 RepID=R7Y527_9ACTN|nr:VOC family protein [Gordonia terrae]EON31163.1 glyoxalase/ bleomycin resistance protein/ dioxygenase [Gordonia terrae C-6]